MFLPEKKKPDPDLVKHPDLARFARLPLTRSGSFIAKSTIAGSFGNSIYIKPS